ncbi:MAG: ABC transporter permease, partial [Lachnospiraceae bacterium]|nr:ABC transporter permease [Lachnospiraceae bacterium]
VLTAGAYFAAFYAPMLASSSQLNITGRTVDYAFFYPEEVNMPNQSEIEKLAEKNNVIVEDYVSQPSATLAVDGYFHVEEKVNVGVTYKKEYEPMLESGRFFSESVWNTLTKDQLDLKPGVVAGVFDSEGYGNGIFNNDISLITNPVTKKTLAVTPSDTMLKNDVLFGCRVLDDSDYEAITHGLTGEWREQQVLFNVKNDSYNFANDLFHWIVASADEKMSVISSFDRITKQIYLSRGEEYFADSKNAEKYGITLIDYSKPDSSEFRLNWMYMPQFRILDQADFTTNMAVFLLLFIFVSILCFSAVFVILFTRSMTLAITNAWVYEDLRKLGATNEYLRQTAKRQISRVFQAPILVGTLLILGFYIMILFGNGDGMITATEFAGLVSCLWVVAAVSSLLYLLYRITLHNVYKELHIQNALK